MNRLWLLSVVIAATLLALDAPLASCSGTGGGSAGSSGCAQIALANVYAGGGYTFHKPDGGLLQYPLIDGGVQTFSVTEADTALSGGALMANTFLTGELYWDKGAEPPAPRSIDLAQDFAAGSTFASCSDCFQVYEGVATVGYARVYFATAGTVNIASVNLTEGPGMGGFKGTGTSLHFVEWNYDPATASDMAVTGGKCIDVTAASFDAGQ